MLAGLSVDYLVRLEQGRASNPSPQVLAALARALRLDDDERDHLYRAAGATPPAGLVPRHVSPSIQRIVDRLGDTPVAVYSPAWELMFWNPLWAALMGDPSRLTGRQRNLIWHWFTTGESAVLSDDPDRTGFATDMVADLRGVLGRYPADAGLRRFVEDLRATSPRFDELWGTASVALHLAERKTIANPAVGPITLDCDVLAAPGADLRLVVYTATPGTRDAEKLDLLRVAGLQSFDDAERGEAAGRTAR